VILNAASVLHHVLQNGLPALVCVKVDMFCRHPGQQALDLVGTGHCHLALLRPPAAPGGGI
jgi:hypothetical protein